MIASPRQFLIFCDAADHRHGQTKVQTLVIDGDGDITETPVGTWLSATEPVPVDEVTRRFFDDPPADLRMRHEFKCSQCGRSVLVHDSSRLASIIKVVWSHGVSELSLAGLEGRLRSQK